MYHVEATLNTKFSCYSSFRKVVAVFTYRVFMGSYWKILAETGWLRLFMVIISYLLKKFTTIVKVQISLESSKENIGNCMAEGVLVQISNLASGYGVTVYFHVLYFRTSSFIHGGFYSLCIVCFTVWLIFIDVHISFSFY